MSKRIDIAYELLNRLYGEEGFTITEIALKLNYSVTCIYNNLKRQHISIQPRRKFKLPQDKLEEFYLNQNMSLNKIGKLFKVSHTLVAHRLQDMGIPIKNRNENAPKGKNHYKWKGGKHKSNGYIFIRIFPDDPFYPMVASTWSYLPEHRYIMAKYLNRCLNSNEIIHHLNGVRDDNRIPNLGIVTRSNHSHHTLQKLLQKRIRELEAEVAQQKLSI